MNSTNFSTREPSWRMPVEFTGSETRQEFRSVRSPKVLATFATFVISNWSFAKSQMTLQ